MGLEDVGLWTEAVECLNCSLTTLQVPVTLQLKVVQPPPLVFTFHFARFWDLHKIWDGACQLRTESVYHNAAAFSSKYRRCKLGGRHHHHGFIGNLARPAIRTGLSVTQIIQQSHSLLRVRK